MRAISSVVLLSSLVAATALAGPDPKADAKKDAAKKDAAKKDAAKKDAAKDGDKTPAAAPNTPTPVDNKRVPVGDVPAGPNTPDVRTPSANEPSMSDVKPEDMPTSVRMRRLEQKTQALKERAWQLKARVQMLKEQMLGGGVGAQAVITHVADMGSSFRLIKLIYTLDGTQVFVRTDEAAESLYKAKSFDIFTGPISPGNHTLAIVATYRGHGYGVFDYLSKYTFTAKGNQAFAAGEGKISKVECKGHEAGGPTTPLEKRAAVDCKVNQVMPDKPAAPPPSNQPGTTPLPTTTPAAAPPAATTPPPPATTPPPAATTPPPSATTTPTSTPTTPSARK